jgi:cytochrome c peroxidase
MNKLTNFAGIILAVILVLVMVYRFMNILPLNSLSKEAQAVAVLNDASCVACHRKDASQPPYAAFPVFEDRIRNDAEKRIRHFDIKETIETIGKGRAVNEVTLAKIEMVTTVTGSMPPATYSLVHWGSSITPAKQLILTKWIRSHRDAFYPNPLAADVFRYEPVRPLPSAVPAHEKRAALGKTLFYDTCLSSDNTLSCASCHNLQTGGIDNRQYPAGIRKILGKVNVPTIYNACFNLYQGWDGHAVSLQAQITDHILDPYVMANPSFDHVVKKLRKDKAIRSTFEKLYTEGLTEASVADALEVFVKTLITPDCRFDKYLKGDEQRLSESEIRGYELFKSNKCATCHAGVILGGQSCEIMGRYGDYFTDRGWEVIEADQGRFRQTADEYDRHRFKVPGLRNVALTRPYFHDGSRQTLHDAVKQMSIYQSGHSLKEEEIRQIVAFLETLTGESSESVPEPSGSIPEPSESVPEPSESIPEPSESVSEPSESIPEPSGSIPESSESVPEPSGSAPKPSGSNPKPSKSVPKSSRSSPKPLGSIPEA